MTLADKEFTSKRNRVKRTRTIFEIIVIVVLLYVIINALFVFAKYKPFTLIIRNSGQMKVLWQFPILVWTGPVPAA